MPIAQYSVMYFYVDIGSSCDRDIYECEQV